MIVGIILMNIFICFLVSYLIGLRKHSSTQGEQMTNKDILKEIHEKIANIPIPYDIRDTSDIVLGESIMQNAILHIVSEYLQRSDNDT